MAEYIDKEILDSELYNRFHDEDEPSNITDVRLGSVRNFVREFPTADVVERSKIEQAIKEMERYGDGFDYIGKHNLGSAVENCIEILKRNIEKRGAQE